jgi:hypothetical protein
MGHVSASKLSGVVEKEVRITWSATYTPARWLTLEARVATSQAKDHYHVANTGWESSAPVTARARVAW